MLRWLLTLLVLLLPTVSHAAIAFVSATNSVANTVSATSITTSQLVSAGTDRLLIVAVQARGSAAGSGVSGITFNGSEAFTLAKVQVRGSGPTWRSEIWYLVNPTVVTANIVVTWPDATNSQAQGYTVLYLTGVAQSSPVEATSGGGGTGTALSTSITTVADNAWIVDNAFGQAGLGLVVGAGQTSRAARILATAGVIESMGVSTTAKTPVGAETMDWTQDNAQEWVHAAASFAPAVAAPPPDPPATATQATLTWTNGTDAIGVVSATIKRCTIISPATACTPTMALTTVQGTNGSAGVYIDQTLASGTSYNWCAANNDAAANQSSCTLATNGLTGGTTYRNTLAVVSWSGIADGADIGAAWDAGYTTFTAEKLVSGRVVPTTVDVLAVESYNALTPGNDQWCQVTVGVMAGAVESTNGCVLRMANPATNNYYLCEAAVNGGSYTSDIIKMTPGPTTTEVSTENATSWIAGDKLRCEAEGTALRLYRVTAAGAETLVTSGTDATHASGKVGITSKVVATGTLTNSQIFDFAMGEFSSTPPVPPTITGAAADATGATLTYGATTPSFIRVARGSNTNSLPDDVQPISAVPGGRYTRTWEDGLTFACFHPIDVLGVENTAIAPTDAWRCDTLVGIVQPLDTTPPVVSACVPSGDLPFNTTSTTMSCVVDKPAQCRYNSTDVAYADMTGTDMMTTGLTCSVTVSGLTNGSTTTKYVRAQSVDDFDGDHPTTSSQTVTITVLGSAGADTTAPSTVTGLVATLVSNSQALLVWTAATDNVAVASYIIFQSTDACVTHTIGGLTTLTSRTLTNLNPGTTYCWTVIAQDTSFNQSVAQSNQASLTTGVFLDVQPPSTPGTLSAAAITSTSLVLQIPQGTDNIAITATSIERCTGLGCGDFRVLMTIPGNFMETLITTLQPSTSYTFRVKFADGAGNPSAYSPLFTVISESSEDDAVAGYCHCHLHH